MYKIITICLCLFFSAQAVQAQTKDGYEKFLDEAANDFGTSAARLNEEYKIGSYKRWDVDQKTGKLIFSDDGIAKVIAAVQIVGSYSASSETWMWSWANKTVIDLMKKDMCKIKEYGEKRHFKELMTPRWECDEDYAWTMTAVAGHLLKAKGAYRGPIENGYVYLLIMDIKWADAKNKENPRTGR